MEAIRAAGGELVVVGQGTPEMAKAFGARRSLTFPIFVDPDMKAYAAAGLHRSHLSVLKPGAILKGFAAAAKGHRSTAVKGDVWQQGGAFVIHPDNRVTFSQIDTEGGDHPEFAPMVAALSRIAQRAIQTPDEGT